MRYFRIIVLFIPFLVISTNTRAQNDDPIKIESSIVRLNVGVVDQRGRPITTLDRSQFSIFEDGVKQQITRFEASTAPFSVVMLLDMSGSTKSFRPNIKLSATRFLDALAPDDRVAVVEFYSKINLLSDFSADKRMASQAIELANGQGETNLYKALQFALDKLAKERTRRKAIVVLTDGVDTDAKNDDRKVLGSKFEMEGQNAIRPESSDAFNKVLKTADLQGVTIYPLALPTGDPKRLADPTPLQFALYDASRKRLQLIADRTGGTLNTINRLEEMGKLYAIVAADLRTLYTIEYDPANDKSDGQWRTVKVEVPGTDLIARSRQGYFAR
ncbi:MAG: VWA domain-containing protein [Pyrinomonadaceae bacterium]